MRQRTAPITLEECNSYINAINKDVIQDSKAKPEKESKAIRLQIRKSISGYIYFPPLTSNFSESMC